MRLYITRAVENSTQRVTPEGRNLPPEGNQAAVAGVRGQYVPLTFVIRNDSAAPLSNLLVVPSSLSSGAGSIPTAAVDCHILKWWYQFGDTVIYPAWGSGSNYKPPGYRDLTPELLLHDDSLVRVIVSEQRNELKVNGSYRNITQAGVTGYPSTYDWPIEDASSLQAFTIPTGECREVWATISIPETAAPGDYTGHIDIMQGGTKLGEVTISLTVYPFSLAEPPFYVSIYYQGSLWNENPEGTISAFRKSETQYREELRDMKAHGIQNPIHYGEWYEGWSTPYTNWARELAIRREVGFPTDRLFTNGLINPNLSDWAEGRCNLPTILAARDYVRSQPGYENCEFWAYGWDESEGDQIRAMLPLYQERKAAGIKNYVTGYSSDFHTWQTDPIDLEGDLLDLFIHSYKPSKAYADRWHARGKLIASYGNPQLGIEQPWVYRHNYGLLLWQYGYDFSLDFAYGWEEPSYNNGFIWDDNDSSTLKDHVMAYPTIGKPIDTVQWEGFREGVYDARYARTLEELLVSAPASPQKTAAQDYLNWLKATQLGIADADCYIPPSGQRYDLDEVRETLAAHILALTGAAAEPPTAGFTYSPQTGTAPLTVQFTDASQGTITSWAWAFGDGGTSTQQNPSHIYQAAGSYTVTLTVTGPGGTSTPAQATIVVSQIPAPVADFSAYLPSPTDPLTVLFTDLSQGATSWSWQFGDGGTSTQQNPLHTYPAAGDYTVTLTVSGPGGGDTETKVVHVEIPAPVAAFSAVPTSGTVPLTVQFTDASQGQITSRYWLFGDGGSSNEVSPSHTYTSPGEYTVTLTVTGPGGPSSAQVNISVAQVGTPVASFNVSTTQGIAPLTVQFSDTSQGQITSYYWAFGDGGTSTERSPSHIYTEVGNFTARLTVTGPGGSTFAEADILVLSPGTPVASFAASPSSGKAPLSVQFQDLSQGTITSWAWAFGDGGSSNEVSPSHTYTTPGNYTARLTVTGPGGSTYAESTILVTEDGEDGGGGVNQAWLLPLGAAMLLGTLIAATRKKEARGRGSSSTLYRGERR